MLTNEAEKLALIVRDIHAFSQQILHLCLEGIICQAVAIPLVVQGLDLRTSPLPEGLIYHLQLWSH